MNTKFIGKNNDNLNDDDKINKNLNLRFCLQHISLPAPTLSNLQTCTHTQREKMNEINDKTKAFKKIISKSHR